MNALRMGLDVAVDTIREVASKYEDSGPSTSGYGVGPPKIESGAYSTGRMQGFGRDGGRHHMEAPSDSTAHREREVERTATGAPKVESGYYSTGKMRGFGSDDVRPNYPKPGSALDRQWNGGGAERVNYRVVGTNLLRTVDCWDGGAWGNAYTDQVAATSVQNARSLFRYFDEDGVELLPGGGTLSAANRDLVRVVVIQLDLTDANVEVLGDVNVDFELRTSVRLRNANF